MKPIVKLISAATLILTLVSPTTIFAAGTGDNPTFTSDIPTAAQQTAKAQKSQLALQKAEQLASGISMFALGESKTIAVPSYQQEKVIGAALLRLNRYSDFLMDHQAPKPLMLKSLVPLQMVLTSLLSMMSLTNIKRRIRIYTKVLPRQITLPGNQL